MPFDFTKGEVYPERLPWQAVEGLRANGGGHLP
jgi:hypothetical protein